MSEQIKCFCDLYSNCVRDPSRKVSVGYNVEEDEEVFIDGSDFVAEADKVCPGTRVFIAQTALNADTVSVEASVVTITAPRADVTLQCEYFIAANPGT